MKHWKPLSLAFCSLALTACSSIQTPFFQTLKEKDIAYMEATYPVEGFYKGQVPWEYEKSWSNSNARIITLNQLSASLNKDLDDTPVQSEDGLNAIKTRYASILTADFSGTKDQFCVKKTNPIYYSDCIKDFNNFTAALPQYKEVIRLRSDLISRIKSLKTVEDVPYATSDKIKYYQDNENTLVSINTMEYGGDDFHFKMNFVVTYNKDFSMQTRKVYSDGSFPYERNKHDIFRLYMYNEKGRFGFLSAMTAFRTKDRITVRGEFSVPTVMAANVTEEKFSNLYLRSDKLSILLNKASKADKGNIKSDTPLFNMKIDFDQDTYKKSYDHLIKSYIGDDLWKQTVKRFYGVDVAGSYCGADVDQAAVDKTLKVGEIYQIRDCGNISLFQPLKNVSLFVGTDNYKHIPLIIQQADMIKGQSINIDTSYFLYNGPTFYSSSTGNQSQGLTFTPVKMTKLKDGETVKHIQFPPKELLMQKLPERLWN